MTGIHLFGQPWDWFGVGLVIFWEKVLGLASSRICEWVWLC